MSVLPAHVKLHTGGITHPGRGAGHGKTGRFSLVVLVARQSFPDSIWLFVRDLISVCECSPAGSSNLLLPPAAFLTFPCKLCSGHFAANCVTVIPEQGRCRCV